METKEFGSFPIPVACTALDGGPTVITVERDSPRVDLRIVFGSGASSDRLSGSAHLLEHLLLTEDVHPELRTAMLAGDEINGETHQSMTQYTSQGVSERVEVLVSALAACVSRPRFERPLFRREQRIVLNELRENRWDIQQNTWERSLMYPKDVGMQRSEFGKDGDIRRMRPADLKAFYETHYVRRNALVISAGGVPHRRLVEAVLASPLMSLPSGERRAQGHVHFTPTNGVFSKHWVPSPGVYLYMPLPVREDERRLVRFASQLLITESYGTVYKRLRLEEGKIYHPFEEHSQFPECWICIGAETSKRAVPSIEQALREEVARVVEGDIEQDAWERTVGWFTQFIKTIAEEENEWFLEYFISRWQRQDLADRWFKDAILNADPAKVKKLISARWRPERITRFRYMP